MTTVYFLRVWNSPFSSQRQALQEKDGVYLSPNGRLASSSKAAIFASRAQANLCAQLWTERLKDRHGETVKLEVEDAQHAGAATKRHEADVVLLVARARSSCFASNRAVQPEALLAARAELQLDQPEQ